MSSSILRHLLRRAREKRVCKARRNALASLPNTALADLGLHRSELTSAASPDKSRRRSAITSVHPRRHRPMDRRLQVIQFMTNPLGTRL